MVCGCQTGAEPNAAGWDVVDWVVAGRQGDDEQRSKRNGKLPRRRRRRRRLLEDDEGDDEGETGDEGEWRTRVGERRGPVRTWLASSRSRVDLLCFAARSDKVGEAGWCIRTVRS